MITLVNQYLSSDDMDSRGGFSNLNDISNALSEFYMNLIAQLLIKYSCNMWKRLLRLKISAIYNSLDHTISLEFYVTNYFLSSAGSPRCSV